ncbi:hypothetical protein [Mycoplasma sp. Ms02]|uniref:hypothetical protein n=1 Tax=Mycoplasma sp. Ms02 TaxID=353851 RepID=UPI001C8AF903|nr:hypothetical protein [Mycoplasma sp. Ms02]QZE12229.1 hypothetical protein K4L35_02700 [Mycoplasma sp. Ms02]
METKTSTNNYNLKLKENGFKEVFFLKQDKDFYELCVNILEILNFWSIANQKERKDFVSFFSISLLLILISSIVSIGLFIVLFLINLYPVDLLISMTKDTKELSKLLDKRTTILVSQVSITSISVFLSCLSFIFPYLQYKIKITFFGEKIPYYINSLNVLINKERSYDLMDLYLLEKIFIWFEDGTADKIYNKINDENCRFLFLIKMKEAEEMYYTLVKKIKDSVPQ